MKYSVKLIGITGITMVTLIVDAIELANLLPSIKDYSKVEIVALTDRQVSGSDTYTDVAFQRWASSPSIYNLPTGPWKEY